MLADLTESSERDRLADDWAELSSARDMTGLSGQVRQVGEIVKLVGVRVAQGWR